MDFETSLGELILKHEKEGLEAILQALDLYVVLLEIRRDQEEIEEDSK
jgi:hypothetical protein